MNYYDYSPMGSVWLDLFTASMLVMLGYFSYLNIRDIRAARKKQVSSDQ